MPDQLIVHLAGTWVDIPGGWATVFGVFLSVVVGPVATLIVTARLSGKVRRVQSDVAATKDQVANNHVDENGDPILLRDEQDERHEEQIGLLTDIKSTLAQHGRDIGGIRAELRTLHETDGETTRQQNRDRERIDNLERTIPRDQLGRFTKKEESKND